MLRITRIDPRRSVVGYCDIYRKMFNVVGRSIRKTPPPGLLSSPLPYNIGRKTSAAVRSHQTASPNQPENFDGKMEQSKTPTNAKTGDAMSNSFGEGYSTRSDEEGFGGIYGGNQSLPEGEEDKIVHGNSPECESFDSEQGSEVKEKETARHQTKPE